MKPPAEERIGVFRADSAVVGYLTPPCVFIYGEYMHTKRKYDEHVALPCRFAEGSECQPCLRVVVQGASYR